VSLYLKNMVEIIQSFISNAFTYWFYKINERNSFLWYKFPFNWSNILF